MDDRTPSQRQDGELLDRAGAGVALALPLTYAGVLWEQLLHSREGAHEADEPGVLAHWLRDGTLALPLVMLAVRDAIAAALLEQRKGNETAAQDELAEAIGLHDEI
jgi:hypothetical protein